MTNIETNVVKPEIRFIENDIENLIITPEFETPLDSKLQGIEDYMKSNGGNGKTDEQKDEIYKNSQQLWHDLALCLRDTKYNFHLNRPQWKFITDLILLKLEYDVNTVFFAIELTDMLGSMKNVKYANDKDLVAFPVNATEITYIYHLISKHKVKGLTKDSYLFAQILQRIGNISKVFNYYDASVKSLSNEIQDWIASLEDGVVVEGSTKSGEITAESVVVKPSKKAKAQ